MSTRKTVIVILALVVAAAITGVVLAMIFANDTQPTSGSIEIPAASGSETTETVDSTEPSSGVDPAMTADDPVPDSVVSELFSMVEAHGDKPNMNEQYTVEFVEDTEHIRLSGTFENGEATYEFEYDDGAWKLDSTDE